MKRILQLLLTVILVAALAMPALADQLISRSITVEVVTNNPTENEVTQQGSYTIVYVPGSDATGSVKTYDYEFVGSEAPRPTVHTPDDLGFSSAATFSYWTGSDGNQYGAGSVVDLEKVGSGTSHVLTLTGVWAGKKTASVTIKDDNGKVIYSNSGEQNWTLDLSSVKVSVPKGMTLVGFRTSSGTLLDRNAVVKVTGDRNTLTAVFRREGKYFDLSICKYITNKKWDKDGRLQRFKAGDTVRFDIVVTNTGTSEIDKVTVYDTLKGTKIKSGSGYKRSDGNAIIRNLAPGESVTVKATYTVKSSDQSKHKLVNMAYAYYKGKEVWDACRIPIRHTKTYEYDYTTTITVYADSSLSKPLNQIVSDFELDYSDYNVNVVYGNDLTTVSNIAAYGGSDVIITVGNDHMDILDLSAGTAANPNRNNRIVSSTRTTPVENRAALVGRKGTVITFNQLSGVLSSGQAKLAVCTNTNDMATQFAKDLATSLALDMPTLKATGAVIECANSTEIAQAVQSGRADLGIMSGSDAVAYNMTTADVANDGICTPVAYPAAVLQGSSHRTASQAFVDYLRSTDARSIFTGNGYVTRW